MRVYGFICIYKYTMIIYTYSLSRPNHQPGGSGRTVVHIFAEVCRFLPLNILYNTKSRRIILASWHSPISEAKPSGAIQMFLRPLPWIWTPFWCEDPSWYCLRKMCACVIWWLDESAGRMVASARCCHARGNGCSWQIAATEHVQWTSIILLCHRNIYNIWKAN